MYQKINRLKLSLSVKPQNRRYVISILWLNTQFELINLPFQPPYSSFSLGYWCHVCAVQQLFYFAVRNFIC